MKDQFSTCGINSYGIYVVYNCDTRKSNNDRKHVIRWTDNSIFMLWLNGSTIMKMNFEQIFYLIHVKCAGCNKLMQFSYMSANLCSRSTLYNHAYWWDHKNFSLFWRFKNMETLAQHTHTHSCKIAGSYCDQITQLAQITREIIYAKLGTYASSRMWNQLGWYVLRISYSVKDINALMLEHVYRL